MRHLCRLLAMAGTVLFCQGAWALGLDTPIVISHLNEPVQARIPLSDTKGMRASDIKVALPDDQVFQTAGIARTAAVDTLASQVVERDHRLYIELTGSRIQREPYLELMLDVAWPGGQLQRQVTLLLDPPGLHSSSAASPAVAQVAPRPESAMPPLEQHEKQRAHAPVTASAPAVASTSGVAREMASFQQRLDDLSLRLDKLNEDDTDGDAILALQAKLDEMKQGQQQFETRLDEFAKHQQALSETLAQQIKRGATAAAPLVASTAATPAVGEPRPAHGLWHGAMAWLSPTLLFAIGGLLVLVGLLLMVHHKRGKSEEAGALIDFEISDAQAYADAPNAPSRVPASKLAIEAWHKDAKRQAGVPAPSAARSERSTSSPEMSPSNYRGDTVVGNDDHLNDDDVDIFIAHGRLEQARELLEGELKRTPANAVLRLKLMEVLGRLGQLEALEEHGAYLATHADEAIKAHALALSHTHAAANDVLETTPEQASPAIVAPNSKDAENEPTSGSSMASSSGASMTVPVAYADESLSAQRHDDVPTQALSFSLDFATGFDSPSTTTVGDERAPGFADAVSTASDQPLFSAGWSLEEVEFEAFDRDNGSSDEEPAHDERLIRAHVLLDAGDIDTASLLLRQILDEGPEPSREAARTLIERFELHTD